MMSRSMVKGKLKMCFSNTREGEMIWGPAGVPPQCIHKGLSKGSQGTSATSRQRSRWGVGGGSLVASDPVARPELTVQAAPRSGGKSCLSGRNASLLVP